MVFDNILRSTYHYRRDIYCSALRLHAAFLMLDM